MLWLSLTAYNGYLIVKKYTAMEYKVTQWM